MHLYRWSKQSLAHPNSLVLSRWCKLSYKSLSRPIPACTSLGHSVTHIHLPQASTVSNIALIHLVPHIHFSRSTKTTKTFSSPPVWAYIHFSRSSSPTYNYLSHYEPQTPFLNLDPSQHATPSIMLITHALLPSIRPHTQLALSCSSHTPHLVVRIHAHL
jgi:hypothetical protein